MRISLSEFDSGVELGTLVDENHPLEMLPELIEQLNRRLKNSLKINSDVVLIQNGRLTAYRIAGVVNLCPGIELEIVPKFLDQSSNWKETFFFLSVISKHGFVLDGRSISSDKSFLESFYEVAGIMLADDYIRLRRKPIRQYRKMVFRDHVWEGEVNFDSLCERHVDGMVQTVNIFTVHNEFNSTVVKAMEIMFPYVHDSKARAILRHVLAEYGPCEDYSKSWRTVPCRNKEWTDLYELSFEIISGMTFGLGCGELHSREFVLNTWQMWEWLISVGISIGMHRFSVRTHTKYDWGVGFKGGRSWKLGITPDISVFPKGGQNPLFLVDAKYKDPESSVERSDLYEAVAFCNGTNTQKIVLVYPEKALDSPSGMATLRSVCRVGSVSVLQVSVAFGDLKTSNGLKSFGELLSEGISQILNRGR